MSVYPSLATDCHLTFSVTSNGEEKNVKGNEEKAMRTVWELWMAAEMGFSVKVLVCVCECVSV